MLPVAEKLQHGLEITKIGKWKENYPIKEQKPTTPYCSPLISHKLEEVQWKDEPTWCWEKISGLLPELSLNLRSLICGQIGVRYNPGEQRDKLKRYFLFRKNEVQNEDYFLKSLGFLSRLLHRLVFTLSRFLYGQVGWSPLILILLLWCDFLSSLLFIPHTFLVTCNNLR